MTRAAAASSARGPRRPQLRAHLPPRNVSLFQECEKSLQHKSELVSRVEGKTSAMADTLQKLDDKFVCAEAAKSELSGRVLALEAERDEARRRQTELESSVLIERDWRQRLQELAVADKEAAQQLKHEVAFLQKVASDYENLRSEHEALKGKIADANQTMEELGQQLSHSKLQVDTMKEEGVAPSCGAAKWKADRETAECSRCDLDFNIARRKHHCRNCGGIFCDACSDNKMALASAAKPVRVCDQCYTLLLDKYSKV